MWILRKVLAPLTVVEAMELLLERLRGLDAAKAASMVERALPLVHTFFAHHHAAQVHGFFAAVD